MTPIPFTLRYSNISHGKSTICKWISYWKRGMSIVMLDYRSVYQLDCKIDEDSIFAVHRMGHRVPFSQQPTLKHFSELHVWKCSRGPRASRVQSLLRNRPSCKARVFAKALRSWVPCLFFDDPLPAFTCLPCCPEFVQLQKGLRCGWNRLAWSHALQNPSQHSWRLSISPGRSKKLSCSQKGSGGAAELEAAWQKSVYL